MAGFSDYAEANVLDYLLTQGPFYIALYTSDPTDANVGTECSGTPYTRKVVTLTRAGSVLSNSSTVSFTESTNSWGTITHCALMSALTGGNQWAHSALLYPKVVNAGETLTFPSGSLTFTLD